MRLINNIAIFAAMALPAPLVAIAQNSTDTVYTLQQCKTLALANNADIRIAENNLQAAIETRKEAFTKYFPEISAGASAFKTHNDVIQYDVLDLF
ncbi:MAG: TolC family protein, partial [Muribaculaceae bacterium]|nr:TolC family protein [Muribaculaceae bacterium]